MSEYTLEDNRGLDDKTYVAADCLPPDLLFLKLKYYGLSDNAY